jgi:hypothetical protein
LHAKTNLPPLLATTKIHPSLLIIVLNHPTWSPSPYNPNTTNKTTRPIRNRDLDERRAKDLCFWCDERGGGKNPLEELIELKQKNDLETYIKDFDILPLEDRSQEYD